MSKKTDNLGLELTISGTTTFEEWRKSINGDNDGTIIELSNMQIIDNEIGDLKEIVEEVRVDIKTAIEDQGVEVGDIPFNEYHLKIAEIEGSSGITEDEIDDDNLLIGWTIPVTYKNAPTNKREFYLKSEYGLVSITGLSDYAIITDNNTNHVKFEITHNGDDDLLIPFSISVKVGTSTYTRIGRCFYTSATDNPYNPYKCVVIFKSKHIPNPSIDPIGELGDVWYIVNASDLPIFNYANTTWNTFLPSQLVSLQFKVEPTTLGNHFMRHCVNFNQPFSAPDVITMGTYSCSEWHTFNQPVNFPKLEKNTGEGSLYLSWALRNWYNFNQPFSLPSLTKMGRETMTNWYKFNQPLDFPELVEIISQNGSSYGSLLTSAVTFNNTIYAPKLTTISGALLVDCDNYNQPINLPSLIIANTILQQIVTFRMTNFNQPLNLPSLETVGDNFASRWPNFNQPLNLPSLKTVGNNFASHWYKFNQPLNLPSLKTVGNNFASDWYKFNQPLNLPSLETVGDNFRTNWYAFNNTENIGE